MPLTCDQRKVLRREFLRLAGIFLGLIVILWMMSVDRGLKDWRLPFFLLTFLGLGVSQLVPLFYDLRAGTALTRVDLLEKILPPGSTDRNYHGRFTELGLLRLPPKIEIGVPSGRCYQLVYSPASRIIWTLEAAGEGAD